MLEKQAQEKILQLGITLSPQGKIQVQRFVNLAAMLNAFNLTLQKHQQAHKSRTNEGFYYLSEKQ